MRESRADEWTSDEERQVAKPRGKTDSKRAPKVADDDRTLRKSGKAGPAGKGAEKRGKAASVKAASPKGKAAKAKAAKAKAPKSGKASKVVKPKRHKGAERLVERVAAQIVEAEFGRVLEEGRLGTENGGAEQTEAAQPEQAVEAVQTAVIEETAAVGEAVAAEAVTSEAGPAEADPAESDRTESDPAESDTAQDEESEAEPVREARGKRAARRPLRELLRVPAGAVDLADYDPSHTPGVASRAEAEAQMPQLVARLDELQERLFAAARGGDSKRRVLLVLQGMDTSGKGGTVRHVVGRLDPNGVRLKAFKAPTDEERAHDFLWRIRAALPGPGEVGIFDRSHYEDVLAGRVRKLALPMVIGKRYVLINKFEQGLVGDGCVVVKCFLHIGPDEQRDRLLTRLDDPAKHWKYNPGDVDDRKLWPEYQDAYRIALEKTSTEAAPWHVVPANRKWYRNYAITRLLVEALEAIDPQYSAGDFDVAIERERVLAS
jgi:PPK2 family polyphosphate:nucleotide phosphotransferase